MAYRKETLGLQVNMEPMPAPEDTQTRKEENLSRVLKYTLYWGYLGIVENSLGPSI